MLDFLSRWYRRYFTDPQASLLVVLLIVGIVTLATMGKMLAPLLAALVIAYLLEGAIAKLQKKKMSRFWAVNLVYMMFVAFMMFVLLILLPLISRQVSQFFKEVPDMISNGQKTG
jgi:putative permease